MHINLTIENQRDCYCPCCLALLSTRNAAFLGRFCFCKTCVEHPFVNDPEAAIFAIVNYLHHRHLLVCRNLIFFVPQVKPPTSVQLLPFSTDGFWCDFDRIVNKGVGRQISAWKKKMYEFEECDH